MFENIAFRLRMRKLPGDEVKRGVERTAGLMQIAELLKRYSGELSGGQRQRVAVTCARAIDRDGARAMEPDVILMDEPLSNLDALLRLEIRAELNGVLAQSRTTGICVTRDQVEARSRADRISVMHGGRIARAATPVEVYRTPAERFIASFIDAEPVGGGKWRVGGQTFVGPRVGKSKLDFAVRPKDFRLADDGLKAGIRMVEPLGAHLRVTGDVDGHLFRAVLDSDRAVKHGDTLTLAPLPDRVRWFDPETTLAVA